MRERKGWKRGIFYSLLYTLFSAENSRNWHQILAEARHVGLDNYDLLMEVGFEEVAVSDLRHLSTKAAVPCLHASVNAIENTHSQSAVNAHNP